MGKNNGLDMRQRTILQILENENFSKISELADMLQVTPQTIRTDIKQLHAQGMVKRLHGGVTLLGNTTNASYAHRSIYNKQGKQTIGALVAKIIPNYASVFLNIGTTTEAVGRNLHNHQGIKIITNNINIAHMCCQYKDASVFITPGEVREDSAILGYTVQEYLNQFVLDYAVIGTSGIDADGYFLDYDAQEIAIARQVIKTATHTILATDISKFGRRAMVKIASLNTIDTIVLDHPPLTNGRTSCNKPI